jgi:outer membrane protein assembly factor BamB
MNNCWLITVAVIIWLSSGDIGGNASTVAAADWPTWRFDAGRTAASPVELPAGLQLQRTRLMNPQKPAWPEDPGLQFDAACEPVAADDLLLFDSSHDDSVTAVSLSTGEQRWKYFAGGPVRFAPLIHQRTVYFRADDGALYCVDLKTGSLNWPFDPAPDSRKVIGSERVISVWPVRGGPVLVDGRIHFTTDVWPFEGPLLYSLDPATGTGSLVRKAGTGQTPIDTTLQSVLTPRASRPILSGIEVVTGAK